MTNPRRHVLFVDDEPRILDGISRMMRPQRSELDVLTASSGDDALRMLASQPVDVVVSDMRMPRMDGADLLAAVRVQHPRVVRILLSGQSDRQTIVRATRAAHQFLAKPCDPIELRNTIARSCALRDLLPDPALQQCVTSLEAIPSGPGALDALRHELDGSASPERMVEIVAGDPGLASAMLHVTSTSFFGSFRGILTPAEAVRRLGSDSMRALVQGDALPGPAAATPEVTQRIAPARRGAAIARACALATDPDVADGAETAALLRDCGFVALAVAGPPGALDASGSGVANSMASPADAGAYLLALWGLPDPIVEAVARHRYPGGKPLRHPVVCALVHVAHMLVSDQESRIDRAFMADAAGADRTATWLRVARSLV